MVWLIALVYVFLEPHTIHVGKTAERAAAIEAGDLDGVRTLVPGAGFGNSYPDRRLVATRNRASNARVVLVVAAGVTAQRVADLVEVLGQPVVLVMRDAAGRTHDTGLVLRRGTDDDASRFQLVLAARTAKLIDMDDGSVVTTSAVGSSPVGVRAHGWRPLDDVLAHVAVVAPGARRMPVTVRSTHAPKAVAGHRVRSGTPSTTAAIDLRRLARFLRREVVPSVERCYDDELLGLPSGATTTTATLELAVASDRTVTVTKAPGLPAVVIGCLADDLMRLDFGIPDDTSATVTVPITIRP